MVPLETQAVLALPVFRAALAPEDPQARMAPLETRAALDTPDLKEVRNFLRFGHWLIDQLTLKNFI